MNDDSRRASALDDLFAFAADELPSLFADDDDDDRSPAQQQSRLPADALSAADVAALLHSVDSGIADAGADGSSEHHVSAEARPRQQHGKKEKKQKQSAGGSSNKARDGRKAEIFFLRKTVLELETRLQVLQLSASRATQELSTYSLLQPQQRKTLNDPEMQAVWCEIAQHQCDERHRSERENARLRILLESQLKVAKSLEKFILLKAAATMEIAKSVDARHLQHLQFTDRGGLWDNPSDAEIFQKLLIGVDQSLAGLDALYEANGLAHMETTQMSAQMRFNPATGMFVEVCATKVLPFGIHETGTAVWNHYCFAKQRMPARHYSYHSHKSIDATQDTIAEHFTVELHAKKTRARLRVWQITRRVVEDDRIVIVWRTAFDPTEFSNQQLSRVRFCQRGYVVIRKPSVARPNVTLLQPCYIIFPFYGAEGGGAAEVDKSVVGAITDFMLSATVVNISLTHQMVENVLLEQTLKSSNRGCGVEASKAR